MTGYCAIILAGGKSSRMGQKKSTLSIHGKTFIDFIIDKLKKVGIDEIIISGYKYDTGRYICVEDIYHDKGPLAGIHAGLSRASLQSALIITEDAPLVPESFIRQLMSEHEESGAQVTVASTRDDSDETSLERIQPLLGIFNRSVLPVCETCLQGDKATVMSMLSKVRYTKVLFPGDELLIRGCNTKEEYQKLLDYTDK